MIFLCLNCGKLNTLETKADHCEACREPYTNDEQAAVLCYAKQAVHYGYDYRLAYEEQVSKKGIVQCKYSLIQPGDLWELLAAAILTNIAYDALKYITRQIVDLITRSPEGPNAEHEKLLSVITNGEKLQQFITYIKEYHAGSMNTPEPVVKAIDEEKRADWQAARVEKLTAESLAKGEKLTPQKMGAIAAQAMRDMFHEDIEQAYFSPSQEQLDSLLQSLKRRTEALSGNESEEVP